MANGYCRMAGRSGRDPNSHTSSARVRGGLRRRRETGVTEERHQQWQRQSIFPASSGRSSSRRPSATRIPTSRSSGSSRSSAGSATRSATRCGACCSRRCADRRRGRSASMGCCTSTRPFPAWWRTSTRSSGTSRSSRSPSPTTWTRRSCASGRRKQAPLPRPTSTRRGRYGSSIRGTTCSRSRTTARSTSSCT